MKRINILLLIAGVLTGLMLNGQDLQDILQKRNEVYFSFQISQPSEIDKLTTLISIDRVDGNQVKAYANKAQYMKFQQLGYTITVLPPPGEGSGVEMAGNTVLSPLTTWNFYPTYENYEFLMAQFSTMYPGICRLDTLTTLASGRRLLVLKISDNAATDESEPEFFYSSSIHGDETTGYVMMLHLADYLLSNYGINPEVTELVNQSEIFICPLANPDGTYYGGNSTVFGARRYNSAGVDLNRNYPDPQDGLHPDGNDWQPETVAFMEFASQHHLVSAINFHGGTEVVNYPWDTWPTLHPDDSWFYYISREYADTVHIHAPPGYMNDLDNGITNGYAWYEVNGGRQDYMNYYQHCREVTIEISATKMPPANQLTNYWNFNWRSFILFLKEAGYGIHGTITDQVTGNPVVAKVFINGHDNNGSEVYSSANLGDYHRPIKAGTYTLEITSPGYQPQTLNGVTMTDHASLELNIRLVPLILNLQNLSITDARCFSATQTISVAGNGTTFSVLAGGNATLIAGLKIDMLPGATVHSGGYFRGYIALSGPFCTSPGLMANQGETLKENTPDLPGFVMGSLIKLYPNPTTGKFILEISGTNLPEKIKVEIYGIRGEKIMSKELAGQRTQEFSISDALVGLYFIKIFAGDKSEIMKLVKF